MPTCHKPQRPAVVVRRCSLNPRTPETTDSLNANSGNNLGTLQAVIAVSLAVFTALLAAPEVRAQTPNHPAGDDTAAVCQEPARLA